MQDTGSGKLTRYSGPLHIHLVAALVMLIILVANPLPAKAATRTINLGLNNGHVGTPVEVASALPHRVP